MNVKPVYARYFADGTVTTPDGQTVTETGEMIY